MKLSKKIILPAIILLAVLFCFFLIKNAEKKDLTKPETVNIRAEDIKHAKIGGTTLKIELALTPEAQERGLSGRTSLADGTGMLFVFQKPGKYFFWMREMNFPIDIIWVDENFQVIYIQKNASPESYPGTFGPNLPSRYVLEVPAGFAEKNNLTIGNPVQFLP